MTVRDFIKEIITVAPSREAEVYFDYVKEDGSGYPLDLNYVTDAESNDGLFIGLRNVADENKQIVED